MLNLLFGAVFFLFCSVQAHEECLTLSNQTGYCMQIKECDAMMEILSSVKKDPSSPEYNECLQFLKDSICGFEGADVKVCCGEFSQENITLAKSPENVSLIFAEFSQGNITLAKSPGNVSLIFALNTTEAPNHPNLKLLDDNICGEYTDDKMIIQSNTTSVFEYPWMALIAYQVGVNKEPEFRCAGTIINKRYILTGAHCVTALADNLAVIKVRVGEHDISKEKDCDLPNDPTQIDCTNGFQEFGIESTHFHPDFSAENLQNDIAVLRLDKDINFGPYNVRPICLPIGSARRIHNKKVMLSGWGMRESGPQSPELLHLKIPLVSNEECAQFYNKTTRFIGNKQMCAGGEYENDLGNDSCIADNGGPLQGTGNYNNLSKYVQYGIFSHGLSKCHGDSGIPSVYTSVSHYVDWILDTMKE